MDPRGLEDLVWRELLDLRPDVRTEAIPPLPGREEPADPGCEPCVGIGVIHPKRARRHGLQLAGLSSEPRG